MKTCCGHPVGGKNSKYIGKDKRFWYFNCLTCNSTKVLRREAKTFVNSFAYFNVFGNGLAFWLKCASKFASKARHFSRGAFQNLRRFTLSFFSLCSSMARHWLPLILTFSLFSLCGDFEKVKNPYKTIKGQTEIVQCPDGYAIKLTKLITPTTEKSGVSNSNKPTKLIPVYVRCEDYDAYQLNRITDKPKDRLNNKQLEMEYKNEKSN